MELAIHWVIRDYFPVAVYQRGRLGRVLIVGGLSESLRLLHLVRRTDHLICITMGDYLEAHYTTMRRVLHLFDLDVERVSVLCNYPDQTQMARAAGLRAFFCNQNALINENIYRRRRVPKRFDAVCNARPVSWKRVPLARRVRNLAIIRGPRLPETEYEDLDAVPHAFINECQLSPRGVAEVLSSSRTGLALSAAEGACLASSEYLLCGLPVVSTPSRGGRDVWYDDDNSIICEPTEEAVENAVRVMNGRIDAGQVDPRAIRARHIAEARSHRQRFIELSARAFAQVQASADPREVFRLTLANAGILPQYRPYSELERMLGASD